MELKDFIGYIIYNVICEYAVAQEAVLWRSDMRCRYVHHLDASGEDEVAVLSLVRWLYDDGLWCV